MIPVRKLCILVIFLSLMTAGCAFGSATNVYITPDGNPAGNCPTGANTHNPTWFNAAANWGSGAAQIGPGSTVLLCGTFTFAAGSTGLTVQGSGTSASPVTIQFDKGAILQAPYFKGTFGAPGGGIVLSGVSNVTVDGKNTGIIQNTDNGTNLGHSSASTGVYISSVSGVNVQNLTIQNIYANAGSTPGAKDSNGWNANDIVIDQGAVSNLVINHNTLNNAHAAVNTDLENYTYSGITISNNTMADHGWSISLGAYGNSHVSGVLIFGNYLTNWDNWQFPSDTYHTDGLIAYTNTSARFPISFYNNYLDTNLGNGSGTSYITCGQGTICTIFNNVIAADSHTTHSGGLQVCVTPMWLYQGSGPHDIYNNTFVGPGLDQTDVIIDSAAENGFPAPSFKFENNIVQGFGGLLATYATNTDDMASSNYNNFYQMAGTSFASENVGGSGTQISYAKWQSSGFDAASTTSNPQLSGTYTLQTGSAAIGLGTNLTSLDINPLDLDKSGAPRPATGNWDSGAYGVSIAPPTNLSATVN
ncbi:MAG: choice-of-anchor Q domain-containing protein [Terriglobales bacterium]